MTLRSETIRSDLKIGDNVSFRDADEQGVPWQPHKVAKMLANPISGEFQGYKFDPIITDPKNRKFGRRGYLTIDIVLPPGTVRYE